MIGQKIFRKKIDPVTVKVVAIFLVFAFLSLALVGVSLWFGVGQWQLSRTISPFEARSEAPEIDLVRFSSVWEELSGRTLVPGRPQATPSALPVGNPEPFGP